MSLDECFPAVIVLPENSNVEDVETNHKPISSPTEKVVSNNSLDFSAIDDDSNRFGSYSKVTLSWEDIRVSAPVGSGGVLPCLRSKKNKDSKKQILKGVSGICKPGTFMAIMGASGAGKTTLLNTLAMKNDPKLDETGSILVNGKPLTRRKTTLLSAYVQQEDFFIGTLTVKEVLLFHATLRMGRNVSMKVKRAKVEKVLHELGLKKVENSLCGMPGGLIRGISGGEKKRLSVACELLMNPPLLFIDEPTSGLDSFMARNIVKLIGKLAKANRTILCTIHQPTSEVFAMFDQLYLVAEGHCAYTGSCKDALSFFKSVNYPCPENFNPADHYIFTMAIVPGEEEECRKRVDEITTGFTKSEAYAELTRSIAAVAKSDDADVKAILEGSTSEFSAQLVANFARSFRNVTRNPGYTKIRLMQCIVIALLGGLAYLDIGNGQESVQDKAGLLFFTITSVTFSSIMVIGQTLPVEIPIIKREYSNGMYGVGPAILPRFLLEIPYIVILTMVQWIIVWGIAGLRRTVANFFTGYVVSLLVATISTTVGYFVATAAGDPVIAAAFTPLMILPFFLFGGLYQNEASTPYYFYPVKYASWFRYSFASLLISEFQDAEITCNKEPESLCVFKNGNQVLSYYHLDPDDLWFPNMFAILIMGVIYLAFSVFFLWLRIKERRKPIKEKSI
ncbi:hypothetical protein ACHWQZ_G008494 [Mnemiopsis leidyi]